MKPTIFISYTHNDEIEVDNIVKFFKPMELKDEIVIHQDRRVKSGGDLFPEIQDMMEMSDIFLLFVSQDYLLSPACLKEVEFAKKKRKEENAIVVPIIMSNCTWKDNEFISSLKCLPKDAQAVSSYTDKSEAYNHVYKEILPHIEYRKKIYSLKFREAFSSSLNDSGFLKTSLSSRKELLLTDIYVYPKLQCCEEMEGKDKIIFEKKVFDAHELIDNFKMGTKLILAGDGQSGKSSLLMRLCSEYREKNFYPILIKDKERFFEGSFEKRIEKAFVEEYETELLLSDIPKDKIILLIDDFHNARDQEKLLEIIANYTNVYLIVDDVFSINIKESGRLCNFVRYRILEYNSLQRDALLKKWLNVSDCSQEDIDIAEDKYRILDEKTAIVDSVLGKVFGKGIMPSYPFFILSIVSTYDSVKKPLDQDITSQGYCYQALLLYYLSKQKVKSDEVDTYMNFLSQFAYDLYNKKRQKATEDEFNEFFEKYKSEYTFTIKKDLFLSNLERAQILKFSLGYYSFTYSYLYYFFTGKFFAEEEDSIVNEDLQNMVNNLHKEENAYITIFIAHHTKKKLLLEKIKTICESLFKKDSPAKLDKSELAFFDDQSKSIIQSKIIPNNYEETRRKELVAKDEQESTEPDEFNDEFAIELRRAIKTVEVAGQILKNRIGSIKINEAREIYRIAQNVHLRLMSNFLGMIKDEKNQKILIDYISNHIKPRKEDEIMSDLEKKENAKKIFWNLNYFVILALIDKIRASLGSSKLCDIIKGISEESDNPVLKIIKHVDLMWYKKQVDIEEIKKIIFEDGNFSEIAKSAMRFFVSSFVAHHKLNYKEISQIKSALGISQTCIQKSVLNWQKNK